jgi:hypothetical protein
MNLDRAHEFESFVYDWFISNYGISITHYHTKKEQFKKGENRQGFEVKNDQSLEKTGNLFISVLRKDKAGNQYCSGVFKKDNRWLYIIGNKCEFYVFSCKQLKNYYNHFKPKLLKGFTTDSGRVEYGFLMNRKSAEKMCAIQHKQQIEINI